MAFLKIIKKINRNQDLGNLFYCYVWPNSIDALQCDCNNLNEQGISYMR